MRSRKSVVCAEIDQSHPSQLPSPLTSQAWLLRLHAKDSGIPYGIALAIGALMIYPETDWIKAVDLAHFTIR